jgi:hypothetical protein
LSFLLSISTKPSLVKFEAGGTATITGGQNAFDAALETDEETKVPKVLHTIYQHTFTSLFLLSTLIDSPYPPPDLIHAPKQMRELEDDGTLQEEEESAEPETETETPPPEQVEADTAEQNVPQQSE